MIFTCYDRSASPARIETWEAESAERYEGGVTLRHARNTASPTARAQDMFFSSDWEVKAAKDSAPRSGA